MPTPIRQSSLRFVRELWTLSVWCSDTSLSAEIAEKQARSIKYQLTIAKLPLAKDIDDFDFAGTPINQALIRDLASGTFLAEQRNAVLVGGTGTGKSHLAMAIARACTTPLHYTHHYMPLKRRDFVDQDAVPRGVLPGFFRV